MEAKTNPPRCAQCGLPVAAWRTERHGRTFCTAFCARIAPPVSPTKVLNDSDELPPGPRAA